MIDLMAKEAKKNVEMIGLLGRMMWGEDVRDKYGKWSDVKGLCTFIQRLQSLSPKPVAPNSQTDPNTTHNTRIMKHEHEHQETPSFFHGNAWRSYSHKQNLSNKSKVTTTINANLNGWWIWLMELAWSSRMNEWMNVAFQMPLVKYDKG